MPGPTTARGPQPEPRFNFLLAPRQNAFFVELADLLVVELTGLGVEARAVTDPQSLDLDGRDVFVVMPPHEWSALAGDALLADDAVAARTIGISAEQPRSRFFPANLTASQRLGAVFDFSVEAADAYRSAGVEAHHLQFGYSKAWDRFRSEGNRSGPEVLFFGNFGQRRLEALGSMAEALGARWSHLILGDNSAPNETDSRWFVTGEAKRKLLASSRVVLNIHQSDEPYFEWLRFTESVLCGAAFLTEPSSYSRPYVAGVHYMAVDRGDMAAALGRLLDDDLHWSRVRSAAYERAVETPLAAGLSVLLQVAERLTARPVPPRLPASRVAEHFGHRSGPPTPPPQALLRPPDPRRNGGNRIEVIVIGTATVELPSEEADVTTLTRVADRGEALRAVRRSSASAVGLLEVDAALCPVTLRGLRSLIADGADVACAIAARRTGPVTELRGLWEPVGGTVDLLDREGGWAIARPSAVDDDLKVPTTSRPIAHTPSPVLVDRSCRPKGLVIVLATFEPDSASFLRQIASIKNQTFTDFTCLVVDDASSAETQEMMRLVLGSDRRFRLITHEERLGTDRNLGRGLDLSLKSCPEFVALANRDDVWFPHRLEWGVSQLVATGASLCLARVVPVDASRRLVHGATERNHPPVTPVPTDLAMMAAVGPTAMVMTTALVVSAMPLLDGADQPSATRWFALCAAAGHGIVWEPLPSVERIADAMDVPVEPRPRSIRRVLVAAVQCTRLEPRAADRGFVEARLADLETVERRCGSSPATRRAIRLHRHVLGGSPRHVWMLIAMFVLDNYIRRAPRRAGIELTYIRAARIRDRDEVVNVDRT